MRGAAAPAWPAHRAPPPSAASRRAFAMPFDDVVLLQRGGALQFFLLDVPLERAAARAARLKATMREAARGGHFAAFEQPEIFVDEIRASFRTVR